MFVIIIAGIFFWCSSFEHLLNLAFWSKTEPLLRHIILITRTKRFFSVEAPLIAEENKTKEKDTSSLNVAYKQAVNSIALLTGGCANIYIFIFWCQSVVAVAVVAVVTVLQENT